MMQSSCLPAAGWAPLQSQPQPQLQQQQAAQHRRRPLSPAAAGGGLRRPRAVLPPLPLTPTPLRMQPRARAAAAAAAAAAPVAAAAAALAAGASTAAATAATTAAGLEQQQKQQPGGWQRPRQHCLHAARRRDVRAHASSVGGGGGGNGGGNGGFGTLTASELSRGLTNADLHLRQHYEEHLAWDLDKEESRVWRRTMFTFDDWKRHRSSFRYVHHLNTILESRIVRGLFRPVMILALVSVAVAAYQTAHAAGLLPALLPALPHIPIEPFQLTSFALSLLLVFRTNSSYQRWSEGRRRFGRITTTCRDVCRQCLALLPRGDAAARGLVARWLIAFCRASKWYIREDEPLADELTPWLQPDELRQLVSSPHPPNFCMLVLSHAVAGAPRLRESFVVQEGLSSLSQSLSACDRILNTPIPLSYTRHTARFLILFLGLLPLALWAPCGWGMVPAVVLTSFVLLGIEEIGVQIEEPFSILALEKLCKKAERHISGMVQMDSPTFALASEGAQRIVSTPWHLALQNHHHHNHNGGGGGGASGGGGGANGHAGHAFAEMNGAPSGGVD